MSKYLDAAGLARLWEKQKATFTEKQISGDSGVARIFNESDGGGAKFEHSDGTESFVGVNNGGQSGLAAQIYADKLVDGKWQGAKLDVYNDGIYYTIGNESVTERKKEENKLVTKGELLNMAIQSMTNDEIDEILNS